MVVHFNSMSSYKKIIPVLLLGAFFLSCNHTTYSVHGKRNQQKNKPSIVLLNRIVEFREQYNTWPFSKEEFVNKGPKFKEAFIGFPYTQATFKVIDNNTMTFFFSEHIQDVQNYEKTKKVDINSYSGEVKFYKENDKFIWKIKMY